MLHIILLILKVIGIALAVILGLLVLAVCLVLFVPVRYEGKASYPNGLPDAAAKVKVSWLLHLIAAEVEYRQGTLSWKARAAWFRFGGGEESADKPEESAAGLRKNKGKPEENETAPPENVEKAKESASKLTESGAGTPESASQPEETGTGTTESASQPEESGAGTPESASQPEESGAGTPESASQPEESGAGTTESASQSEESGTGPTENADKPGEDAGKPTDSADETEESRRRRRRRPHPLRALRNLAENFRKLLRNIKYTFRKICGMIEKGSRKKEELLEFLDSEVHRSAFAKAKKELVWVKRLLKPRKLSLDLHFGFEDPGVTGQALAALGMIYPLAGYYMDIQPDFERQVLEGEAYIKGRLRMIHGAMLCLTMILDKNVRRTYRDVRNMLK